MEKEFLNHIKTHKGILHKVCFSYSNTPEEFRDLFQEVMYQLWRSYGKFRGDSKISTWMYKVALFTALAHLKKNPKLKIHSEDFIQDLPDEPENEEHLEQLRAAMQTLPNTDKAVLLLYLEDHSYREMAEVLGIYESNIGVKLNRIKSKLKQQIKV